MEICGVMTSVAYALFRDDFTEVSEYLAFESCCSSRCLS